MKTQLFCIRDVVSHTYGTPFASVNEGSAIRSVSIEVNSGRADTLIAQNPDDFELYKLGTYDDENGRFDLLDAPQLILRCSALLKSEIPTPAISVS